MQQTFIKRLFSPYLSDVDWSKSLFGLVDAGQNSQVVIVEQMLIREDHCNLSLLQMCDWFFTGFIRSNRGKFLIERLGEYGHRD